MTGVGLDIGHERLIVELPSGYTVDKLVHQKLGSAGTGDPLNQRERVILTIKEHGWPT